MGRSRAVVVAVACAALAVQAGACGGDGGAEGASEGARPGDGGGAPVVGSIEESTLFATQRAFGLSLEAGGEGVRVGAIQLRSPLFAEVEPQERDVALEPGGRPVVMPLRYGEAVCDGDVAGDAPTRLATDVDGEDLVVPLGEVPEGLLAGIHADECAAAAVLADVDLRLGDTWVPAGERTLAGTFTATQRSAGAEATLAPLEGNVIFGVTTDAAEAADAEGGEPWLVVDDEHPEATGAVTVRAARCDPHALIEYKRTFVFTIRVAVGDAEPALVDVEAEGPAHTALEGLLAACLG